VASPRVASALPARLAWRTPEAHGRLVLPHQDHKSRFLTRNRPVSWVG